MHNTVHFIIHRAPDKPERWRGACGVNNQVAKPGTTDAEQVTCLRCLDHLTRP